MSSVLFDAFNLSSAIALDFSGIAAIMQPLVQVAKGASELIGMFV
ncbi:MULTISPECIES: hypothetical protein [Corynebacterium]|nr:MULTISPECIES: hypothetical protein [Corynebacterium]